MVTFQVVSCFIGVFLRWIEWYACKKILYILDLWSWFRCRIVPRYCGSPTRFPMGPSFMMAACSSSSLAAR